MAIQLLKAQVHHPVSCLLRNMQKRAQPRFDSLRLGAGITKSADQSFPSFVRIPNGLLNSSNAEMAGC